jgi:N-acetylglucosaminyldiphosphoundecaprenol N-acetyl-beta-D-mannosaminyltransferase
MELINRPLKYSLLGVNVSFVTYESAAEFVFSAIASDVSLILTNLAVHGLILASRNPAIKEKINRFDSVAPDGHPVRWAINLLYGAGLTDRVYGPAFMEILCAMASERGIGIFLFGSYQHVVDNLRGNLIRRFPKLQVLGAEPHPFRPLSPEEDDLLVQRINESGAGLVFLGLGCPLQEEFAFDHRQKIKAVQVCVGAAFDFHSGNKKMAPEWMQRRGLEWFYRLSQEPRRLWRRYLYTNSVFVYLIAKQWIAQKTFSLTVKTYI